MKVKKILVSQPKPTDITKTGYENIITKFKVSIEFEKFIKVEDVDSAELRQEKIHLADYTAIILTSRTAVDQFFRIAKEMRYNVPEDLKYFCVTENTALYLQHYIQYRKRKIFFSKQNFTELLELIKKHKEEKFFMPCSNIVTEDYNAMLTDAKIECRRFVLFRTVPSDLSHIDIKNYDMLVFFSPAGIESLKKNFPDFTQGDNVAIGGSGVSTCNAVTEAGFTLNFGAPTATAPSITAAIEQFLNEENKKERKTRAKAKSNE